MGSFSTPAVGGGPVIYAADLAADFSTNSTEYVDAFVFTFTLPWRANLLILPYIDYVSVTGGGSYTRVLYDGGVLREVSNAYGDFKCFGYFPIFNANPGPHTVKIQVMISNADYTVTLKRPSYFRILAMPV